MLMLRDVAVRGEALPSPSGRYYRPELDALRFLAFFMVFLGHAIPLKTTSSHLLEAIRETGALGVPIFFMLSSYLITELLTREKAATGALNVRAFYIRRILRIWPLYFFALLTGFAALHVLGGPTMSIAALIAYVALVGNWFTVFNDFLPGGLSPLWSIGVEEQFYVFWPPLMRIANRKTMFIASITLWAISQLAVLILCAAHASIRPVIWANSFTHIQYFALGSLISLTLNGSRLHLTKTRRIVMIGLGFALLFSADFIFNAQLHAQQSTIGRTYPGYLVTGIGAALIFLGVLDVPFPPLLKSTAWLGKISYGLYVFHLPCVLLAIGFGNKALHLTTLHYLFSFLIGLPLTIAAAALSYRFLESPFLRIKDRFEIIKSRAT